MRFLELIGGRNPGNPATDHGNIQTFGFLYALHQSTLSFPYSQKSRDIPLQINLT
jgi:hypothetical protein